MKRNKESRASQPSETLGSFRLHRRFLRVTGLIAAGFACAAFLRTDVPAEEPIRLACTGAAMVVVRLVADRFEESQPGTRVILVSDLESSGIIRAVADEKVDVGVLLREPEGDETSFGLVVTPFADSPIVFVAAPNLGLSKISTAEIEALYRGDLWEMVPGGRVRVVLCQRGEVMTRRIGELTENMGDALRIARSRPGMLIADTERENLDLLETVPGAIGFSTLGQVTAERRHVTLPVVNRVDVFRAGPTGGVSFPRLSFFLAVEAHRAGEVHAFIDFLRSCTVRDILSRTGYRPVFESCTP